MRNTLCRPRPRILFVVLAFLVLSTLFLRLSASSPLLLFQVNPGPRPIPIASEIKINEFIANAKGVDNGNESIEIVNTGTLAASVSNWTIHNAQGNTFFTFPTLTIPGRDASADQNYYVNIRLGASVPSMVDDSFTDGDFSRTLFLPSNNGNLLADSGAIYLEGSGGAVKDAVIYGEREPIGAGVDKVRTSGAWTGPRVNTNYDSGGIPILDGGVVGRDSFSTDTNAAGDWKEAGGKHATGPTPGRRNDMTPYTAGQLVFWAQGAINELFLIHSLPNGDFLSVVGASHSNETVVDPDLAGGFSVVANHSFDVQDSNLGTTNPMSGNLTITFDRTTAAAGNAYSLAVAGTLAGGSKTLDLSFQQDFSGFGTKTLTSVTNVVTQFTSFSSTYSYSNTTTVTEEWTAQNRKLVTDHRAWVDWSGIQKTSDSTRIDTYTSDGVVQAQFALSRSYPFRTPCFGCPQTLRSFKEVSDMDFVTTIDAFGTSTRSFSRWDHSLDNSFAPVDPALPPGRTLFFGLQSGSSGTLTNVRTSGPAGDIVGTFTETGTYPLRFYHVDGSPAWDLVQGTQKSVVQEFVMMNGQSVFVQHGTFDSLWDGSSISSVSWYTDQCGCGCGGANCNCGSPPPSSGGINWTNVLGQGVIWGACGVGAAATSPSVVGAGAFAAGSAIVGTLWSEAFGN